MSPAFHLLAKPIGAACNLACDYCFYREKAPWLSGRMSDAVLEAFIQQQFARDLPEIPFAWQGGEPTLLGVGFFRKVVALQRQHGKRFTNTLQTNGTLLDEEWAAFLAEAQFLVGVSIDGPPKWHDRHRDGSYARAHQGLRLLQKQAVPFNLLTVVHRDNVQKPLELYWFLKQLGTAYLQFIPLVERRSDGTVTERSVPPRAYGAFLAAIFDEWAQRDVGRVFVQIFEAALAKWLRLEGGLCLFSERCGNALIVEQNGDLYACDHFVTPEWRLGNLQEQRIEELAASPKQAAFGAAKAALPRYCQECPVRFACHGECPKNRFARAPDGEPGLNYLCPGYRHFFTHAAPKMEQMAALLRAK